MGTKKGNLWLLRAESLEPARSIPFAYSRCTSNTVHNWFYPPHVQGQHQGHRVQRVRGVPGHSGHRPLRVCVQVSAVTKYSNQEQVRNTLFYLSNLWFRQNKLLAAWELLGRYRGHSRPVLQIMFGRNPETGDR